MNHAKIRFRKGNLLESKAQALVNTVNCNGVMGKGIALDFKRRYPKMFANYVAMCHRGEVRLGEPYIEASDDVRIVNFPTKAHWKSNSRLIDIKNGLRFLRDRLAEWHVESIAIPPLGCGHGGLSWNDVKPLILSELRDLPIEIEVYVPYSSDEPIDDDPLDHPRSSHAQMRLI